MSKKRQNFPVSWYVSRIVCLAYSAPHFILREIPKDTRHQRPSTYWSTYVKRGWYPLFLTLNNPPLRKGPRLLSTARRGLGAEHGKRTVTDGKGSLNKPLHVEAPPNKTFEKYNPRGFFSEFYSSFNLFPRGCDPSIHCKKLYFLTLLKTVPKTMFKESVLKKKV